MHLREILSSLLDDVGLAGYELHRLSAVVGGSAASCCACAAGTCAMPRCGCSMNHSPRSTKRVVHSCANYSNGIVVRVVRRSAQRINRCRSTPRAVTYSAVPHDTGGARVRTRAVSGACLHRAAASRSDDCVSFAQRTGQSADVLRDGYRDVSARRGARSGASGGDRARRAVGVGACCRLCYRSIRCSVAISTTARWNSSR